MLVHRRRVLENERLQCNLVPNFSETEEHDSSKLNSRGSNLFPPIDNNSHRSAPLGIPLRRLFRDVE